MKPIDRAVSDGIDRRTVLKAGAVGVAASGLISGEVAAHPDDWDELSLEDQLELVEEETEQYDDLETAADDGYFSSTPLICGMGFHYMKDEVGDPGPPFFDDHADVTNPESLVYSLDDDKLKLTAVEYIVPTELDDNGEPKDDPPDLFNDEEEPLSEEPLLGTSEDDGWVLLEEGGLVAWTLHVWVHEENDAGVFHPTNPEFHDMPGCLGH